jgi:hypothetical protein
MCWWKREKRSKEDERRASALWLKSCLLCVKKRIVMKGEQRVNISVSRPAHFMACFNLTQHEIERSYDPGRLGMAWVRRRRRRGGELIHTRGIPGNLAAALAIIHGSSGKWCVCQETWRVRERLVRVIGDPRCFFASPVFISQEQERARRGVVPLLEVMCTG